MKPLARAPNDNLTEAYHASQVLIAELEARLVQLADQLLVANASLEREIADRKRTEDEFRRSTDQLRELSACLQSVREEERTHIAQVIHDELGQTLTGLKMDVAWLQRHFDRQQPALFEKTQAVSDLIDITIQTVRCISSELRPGILDDLGLVATIEWQLQEFQTRSGIQGKLISAPEETTLDADGATAAFRIFQEILTNVARHAQATQDDRPIVRQGLRQTLSEIPDMGVAGEADPQQGPGSGPDRRIAGESEGRGGAMTIKETNVMPQWQTFNVVGGMIARNEAG